MDEMEIRRPTVNDIKELHEFFNIVITDTFLKEGIADQVEDLELEIETKKSYLESDLLSDGKNRCFLIALADNKIIGSIEYGPASDLIHRCTNGAYKNLHEVGTIFVHPDYQRQGVGSQLLENMYQTLINKGIEEFCLDSGYINAQIIWKRKFGEPAYVLKDYWGAGFHHMIWRIKVSK